MATIQVDLTMLPERFDLTYIDEDGQPQRPIAIHRAIYGSLERFIGILDRALRRRVPAVGRAGPGRRDPDRRPPRRGGRASSPACCARAGCGSRSTTPTTGCRTRSGSPRSRRCRTCSSSATARSRRGRRRPGRAPASSSRPSGWDELAERLAAEAGAPAESSSKRVRRRVAGPPGVPPCPFRPCAIVPRRLAPGPLRRRVPVGAQSNVARRGQP